MVILTAPQVEAHQTPKDIIFPTLQVPMVLFMAHQVELFNHPMMTVLTLTLTIYAVQAPTAVMETDRARSPLARKVIRLEVAPPGVAVIRIIPTKIKGKASSYPNKCPRPKAIKGISIN